MTALPTTLDEVLIALDEIIDETVKENNFLGIFAYVYRRTTAQIKQALEEGAFEDNDRMEKLDVTFANYYIDAYHKYKNKHPTSASWATSFDAQQERITCLQHLLMGMNAHINLDLGVAACKVMKGKDLSALENDYNTINEILANLTNEMQDRLARVSPLLFLLDWVGKDSDEKIANFGIEFARGQSWRVAQQLWRMSPEEEAQKIEEVDQTVASINRVIKRPRTRLLRWVLRLIHFFESKKVEKIVQRLST